MPSARQACPLTMAMERGAPPSGSAQSFLHDEFNGQSLGRWYRLTLVEPRRPMVGHHLRRPENRLLAGNSHYDPYVQGDAATLLGDYLDSNTTCDAFAMCSQRRYAAVAELVRKLLRRWIRA